MRYLVPLIIATFLFSHLQDAITKQPAGSEQNTAAALITVKAERRGFPNINLANGHELSGINHSAGASLVAVVAADFDSDGQTDLITADSEGEVSFYQGMAMSPNSQQLNGDPFRFAGTVATISFEPDYLAAGDFNADGRIDILAAQRNGNSLTVLAGDGHARFLEPQQINLSGRITALATGEIGHEDGQADLAVGISSKNGPQLWIYEYPEGAFKHAPEVFDLPADASDIAIGNLDSDFYADIAVASATQVTVVQGRGQAYPWDLDKKLGINRPAPLVSRRQLSFEIEALAIGNFDEGPGDQLALLSDGGTISILEPTRLANVSNRSNSSRAKQQARPLSFLPTDSKERHLAVLDQSQSSYYGARQAGMSLTDSRLSRKEREELRIKSASESLRKFEALGKGSTSQLTLAERARAEDNRRRSKQAFLETIAAQPAPVANWQMRNLISDSRLAIARNSVNPRGLVKARLSASGKDDLLLLDQVSNQINIIQGTDESTQAASTDVISLDVENKPTAVLPLRINGDGLTDLIVLRAGSSSPSITLTAAGQTFTVNSTSDGASNCLVAGATCTLRQAIQLANSSAGADAIAFSIFGCGPHKIQPLTELPVITQAVTIQGSTQPCYSGTPLIEINGSLISGAADGLKIRTSSAVIQGLAINQFPAIVDPDTGSRIGGNGITLESTTTSLNNNNNTVWFNYLGVDPNGSTDRGNAATGLNIFDSDSNFISGNTMSGNDGAGLSVTAGDNNTIVGNRIGINAAGTAKLPNDLWGVFLTGNNNHFGGDGASDGNTVSGNGKAFQAANGATLCKGPGIGIYPLISEDTGALLTNGNTLKGNRVGTNPAGTAPLGNCTTGIVTDPITSTTIGSITSAGRNIVSDNGFDAIHCDAAIYDPQSVGGYCSISGNNVGTDITGTVAMTNDWRNVEDGIVPSSSVVYVFNNDSLSNVGAPGGTTQGEDCTGFCNLISGNNNQTNQGADAALGRYGFGNVIISNNFVGTNKAGTAALPNAIDGIFATNNDTSIGGYIADQNTNLGNLVSGNTGAGIYLTQGFIYFNAIFNIEANLIGSDTTGGTAIPNGPDNTGALSVLAYPNMMVNVGGINPFSKNYISGNNMSGIWARGLGGQVNIVNNYIGFSKFNQPLGNTKHGILLEGVGTTVGGTSPSESNAIYNNTLAGVAVQTPTDNAFNTLNNSIRGNSIRDNGGLGIDLTISTSVNGDGVTPNDCSDEDEGPNRRQNFPELFTPTFNQDGTVTVTGFLKSQPGSYTVDFYSNTAADPSQYGEGEAYLGSKSVTTNGNGFAAFEFTSTAQVSDTKKITATATDANGNTSEFSCYAGGCQNAGSASTKAARLQAEEEASCVQPIVVNITTDEPDADGDQPDPNLRDGKCDVAPQTPDNQCSLRAAIQEANARTGQDVINFNIPGGGVQTIAPSAGLPPITGRVTIDATTQPGYSGSPLIELSGANVTASDSAGLDFRSGSGGGAGGPFEGQGSTVVGMTINRWGAAAIHAQDSNSFQVKKCYIGINPDGLTADTSKKSQHGLLLERSRSYVGGSSEGEGNVISNNSVGVQSDQFTVIAGNKIGTDVNGTKALSNEEGVDLYPSDNDSDNIGGGQVHDNVISGNTGIGIQTFRARTDIGKNLIGTSADGNFILAIGKAGVISTMGQAAIRNNTIAGFTDSSVPSAAIIAHGDENEIVGNKIGVRSDGTGQLPNLVGIRLINSSNSKIKADDLAVPAIPGNVIGFSIATGIEVTCDTAEACTDNEITDNLIKDNGKLANNLPNDGILLQGSFTGTNISRNTITDNGRNGVFLAPAPGVAGGETSGTTISDNKITGNGEVGLFLVQSSNSVIQHNNISGGNKIGIRLTRASNNNRIENNEVADNQDFDILLGTSTPSFSTAAANVHPASGVRASEVQTCFNFEISQNNTIKGNLIKNSQVGLAVTECARNNVIGDPDRSLPNIFTGNASGVGYGMFLGTTNSSPSEDAPPSDNKILGNLFGQDANSPPNKVGLFISQAVNNTVGSDNLSGNVFVANSEQGILISGAQTRGNLIGYNFIGVGADASLLDAGFGNGGDGITVLGSGLNTIRDNRIGNNHGNGINVLAVNLQAGDDNSLIISGNEIGVAGNSKIGNTGAGIRFNNVQHALVGAAGDAKNIIAANGGDGILIEGSDSKLNLLTYSIIGTNAAGANGLGNGGHGVYVRDGRENTLGGVTSASLTVAGNAGNGIVLENTTGNVLYGNRVGVFRKDDGTHVKLGNGQHGVVLLESPSNSIGDRVLTGYRNFIGGNTLSGIVLQGAQTQFNRVRGNAIGTDLANTNLGNSQNGVLITGLAQSNTVGGADEIDNGNLIAYNGGDGVLVDPTALCCNVIDPNSIYANTGLGIDLGPVGATANDPGDADSGPNNLQNFPEFISAVINSSGNLVIQYKIDSTPGNSNYGTDGLYVEFFEGDASLQGQTFIGSGHYTEANYNNGSPGTASVIFNNASGLGVAPGDKLVATATDASGNTSEFTSTNVGTVTGAPTATNGTITGAITDADGKPIEGVTVRLDGTQNRKSITDGQGLYSFAKVETTGFYSVTPSRANYEFIPEQRAFSLIGQSRQAVFTAVLKSGALANPLDTPEYFVRQQYLDFLGREPDEAGFNFWSNQILECGTDTLCISRRRENVSAAFFLSIEFQETGGFIDGLYRVTYGSPPRYGQFMADRQTVAQQVVVGQTGWQARLEANKQAFVDAFVSRQAFRSTYDGIDNSSFVDAIIRQAGVVFSSDEREILIDGLATGNLTRGGVVRAVVESQRFASSKFNQAFVLMEYFGYLRRDPDEAGYQYWLNKLNQFNGNFEQAEMVKAFIVSGEYRQRFPR